ncbi:hypothetical protein M408DRAFT_333011 [Serendipita vermifera MAFF 305830]|uniref:Uncharacterized protein n=1 Tax=Serendipita vermifera MAFF 305830 TaxID=933852 RepID=A0A0C3AQA4_SERVB|nr:hypothetical protein M408DRAFT_333011 [Serendipita vermifera MAFF 305830]
MPARSVFPREKHRSLGNAVTPRNVGLRCYEEAARYRQTHNTHVEEQEISPNTGQKLLEGIKCAFDQMLGRTKDAHPLHHNH